MEQRHVIAGTPEVTLGIRVRGMSRDQRYFDLQSTTARLTPEFVVIRLKEMVDLDTEIHVSSTRTQVGGNFRVVWIRPRPQDGDNLLGLELLDQDGEIWGAESMPNGASNADAAPTAPLECERCHQVVSIALTEADAAFVGEGFAITRHCEKCKGNTVWSFHIEKQADAAAPEPAQPAAATPVRPSRDLREKGRAPLRMGIKIIRVKYGLPTFDICETINVSRNGVYFTTEQGYEPGEVVQVILPYHPQTMSIPVPAQVVRQDARAGTYQKRVALRLNP